MFPLILALALGVINFDGIEAGQRLHQHRLTFIGELVGFLNPRHQRALDQPVHQQRQGIGEQRDKHQRATDDANHQQDQQRKRQVDKGGQGQRRKKVADRLELLEVLREAPHPLRA